MSEMTTLLGWIHWTQLFAQKFALVGSGLFAGAVLYRACYGDPLQRGAAPGPALRAFRDEAQFPDRMLARIAALTAVAAAVACLSGAGTVWLLGALAQGLSAIYIVTEIRRTRRALEHADPGAEMLAREWLDRWRRQNLWLAANAAWVPWLLVFQF